MILMEEAFEKENLVPLLCLSYVNLTHLSAAVLLMKYINTNM
jgi:hypothetical protein